jgi:DNA-binding NarL/FixJ family response regulator
MSDEIRVLIADDHPVVRGGLRMAIQEDPGLRIVGEAADGEAALAAIEKLLPNIAVLDIDMPKLGGLGVAREIHDRRLSVEIIFLTMHAEEDLLQAAIDLGIQGYILKDSAMLEIAAAIRSVAAGRPYLDSTVAARLLQRRPTHSAAKSSGPLDRLTPTERRIVQWIAADKSSKEIGAELSIHYRTVENHRTNICRKLGLEGANALLRFALQNKSSL